MSAFAWFLLLPQLVSSSACADAVSRQLAAWHATSEVLKTAGGPLGGEVYRIATEELGVWITLHRPKGLDTTSLFLTKTSETLRLDFAATCEVSSVSIPSPPAAAGAFTDADLRSLVAKEDRVVVYLWSPHLPLSVEGYAEIAAATARVGGRLVALVDPSADRGFVDRVGDAQAIPAEARRPMGAVELLFRDLAVHTPSVLVFANGAVSAPLPGYRNRDAYVAFLEPIVRGEPAEDSKK